LKCWEKQILRYAQDDTHEVCLVFEVFLGHDTSRMFQTAVFYPSCITRQE
jgi:hypothetical protein